MGVSSLKKLNYQYEVTMGIYMLENWEKCVVNFVVCASLILILYTTVFHLPEQGMSLVRQVASYTA